MPHFFQQILSWHKIHRGLSFGSLGIVFLWGGMIQIGADAFLHPSRRSMEPRHRSILQHPLDHGMKLRPFSATTADGAILEAIEILPAPFKDWGTATNSRAMRARLEAKKRLPSSSPGTIVMSHGRSGIKEDQFPIAERFVAAGFRCLVYDLRAHGESGGAATTYGHLETSDLACVLEAAGLPPDEPLFAFGISLGAAVTLQYLPSDSRIRRAAVVAPFSDLLETTRIAARNKFHFEIPAVVPLATWWAGQQASFDPWKISPLAAAAKISQPIMIVHGDSDGVIPLKQGRQVFEAISSPAKCWRLVPGGTHRAVLATGGDQLYEEILSFFLDDSFPRTCDQSSSEGEGSSPESIDRVKPPTGFPSASG